ncbi:MAG: hypothetical protein HZB42_14040 [Sphingobacteriales bacterium]|nr:hypothetical protein [Sphingobacteriales bacterium]
MFYKFLCRVPVLVIVLLGAISAFSQTSLKPKYSNSSIYTGIEVGSKGVKLSVIEIGKNAQSSGAFRIIKDSSVNTDFISFTSSTFSATLNGLCGLYFTALKDYEIPSKRIFTVVSSGVKMQAEKDNKMDWVNRLIDSFRIKIYEPSRRVEVVDVTQEAWLSHLGIVPEARRFSTFLIDIGSGNTKGGFFPYGNMDYFKLFQLNWGTKSVANATDKRCEGDNSLDNYNRQMYRVLGIAENSEIIYAVNSSGSYPLSDYIAISGGIAWAVANLLHPEMIDNPVITVSYPEVEQFCQKLYSKFETLSPANLAATIGSAKEKEAIIKETARVQKVFDQKSLMAGAGLLLKIMRQFVSAYETKQFYLVKNGQVGWVSAYVDQTVNK